MRCKKCKRLLNLFFFGCDRPIEHTLSTLNDELIKLIASFKFLMYAWKKRKQPTKVGDLLAEEQIKSFKRLINESQQRLEDEINVMKHTIPKEINPNICPSCNNVHWQSLYFDELGIDTAEEIISLISSNSELKQTKIKYSHFKCLYCQ